MVKKRRNFTRQLSILPAEQSKDRIFNLLEEEQIKQMNRDLERAETSPEIFNMRDVENYDSELQRVLR